MKKMLAAMFALGILLSGCLPASLQPGSNNPTPLSDADLQATAAILSQQTLEALPTEPILPSETPVVMTASATPTQATATETLNPILLTLTATLGTGTVTANNGTPGTNAAPFASPAGGTPNPAFSATVGTAQPLFYGTLPPHLPSSGITLINKAKVDVYISLRCVTSEGYVTILEYPVKGTVNTSGPVGKYTYVAWVGGRQFTGAFSLANDYELIISIFKDRIGIKKN